MLDVAIVLLLAEAGYTGWKKGVVTAASGVIALMVSTLLVKIKGDEFLWRIFEVIRKLFYRGLEAVIGTTPDPGAYYQGFFGDQAGTELLRVAGFTIAFAVMVIGLRLIMEGLDTRKAPVVGSIDGFLGIILGVIGRMCTFWVVCLVFGQMAAGSETFSEAMSSWGGLFKVIYETNPLVHII